jgi:predicted outer membrane repeat protein
VKKIKLKYFAFIAILFTLLLSINSIVAADDTVQTLNESIALTEDKSISTDIAVNSSGELQNKIETSENNDEILIEPGTYQIHNIQITRNITIEGNGNPRDVIINGENKSSIFLIRSPDVHVTFKNITFINGLTHNFGGAISIETGNVYVDNCIFINNTALSDTNAGAISNYGTKKDRGYLYVNNSLFINNHADHDGGAITTCYANSDIYNCVFINNSACRDGGAIRVSVFGYGNVEDCIFMFNHADEWGGAYYSWSGESNIQRCIFLNNTAGTNGGAVMVSGNINIEQSIIANNDGGETGGSFYIQQPMYDTKTIINVHDNLITNNTSPYGKEIFIKWDDSYNLYTQFDNNDWGDENPNDSSVIDPNNVTPRSKVSSTIKSNLYGVLNVDLLDKYNDLIGSYFKGDSLSNLKQQFDDAKEAYHNSENQNSRNGTNSNPAEESTKYNKQTENNENLVSKNSKTNVDSNPKTVQTNTINNINGPTSNNTNFVDETNSNSEIHVGNSSQYGENNKAYELNETQSSVSKQATADIRYYIAAFAILFILLGIGYLNETKKKK